MAWIDLRYSLANLDDKQFKNIQSSEWKRESIAGGQTLTEIESQRGILLRDAISSFLFLVAMTPLYYILRKYTGRYNFLNREEKSTTKCT